jgi:uncharacterized metal-binding protein YceD (DUF177 family)
LRCSFKTGSSRCTRRKLKTEALERLKELILEEHKGEVDEDKTQEEENIDPRWDKLKQLLTDK